MLRVRRDTDDFVCFSDLALYQQGVMHERDSPSRRVEKEASEIE